MRIHILGASGSGTTTLGKALSRELNYQHLDTDDFFWMSTNPPFQVKRPVDKRIESLSAVLKNHKNWILTGSLCGWGDVFISDFDLVIFLYLPQDIRLSRLKKREIDRYGAQIEEGSPMYDAHEAFMTWASKYDHGDENMRSKALHEKWIQALECKVLSINGDIELEDKVILVKEMMTAED